MHALHHCWRGLQKDVDVGKDNLIMFYFVTLQYLLTPLLGNRNWKFCVCMCIGIWVAGSRPASYLEPKSVWWVIWMRKFPIGLYVWIHGSPIGGPVWEVSDVTLLDEVYVNGTFSKVSKDLDHHQCTLSASCLWNKMWDLNYLCQHPCASPSDVSRTTYPEEALPTVRWALINS